MRKGSRKAKEPATPASASITPLGHGLRGAAQRLGVSVSKVNQLIRPDPETGEPPLLASFTIGRRRIILDEDIVDLAHRLKHNSEGGPQRARPTP